MRIEIETERLLLRDMRDEDAQGIFDLDSNADVMRYLGGVVMDDFSQAVETVKRVQQQYDDLGVGRLTVIEKASAKFVGWTGLKLMQQHVGPYIDYYDVGYRLLPEFWGQGYATETGFASLQLGFAELDLQEILGMADLKNVGSNRVLQKIGLQENGQFEYRGAPCACYKITRAQWMERAGIRG